MVHCTSNSSDQAERTVLWTDGAGLDLVLQRFFIKNVALSNVKTAVYIYVGRCAGGQMQFFTTLSLALGTDPVSSICQICPNINHFLIASELFWHLKVYWAPEHIFLLSTFLQQVLFGLEQLLQLQGAFFFTRCRNCSSESFPTLTALFNLEGFVVVVGCCCCSFTLGNPAQCQLIAHRDRQQLLQKKKKKNHHIAAT